MYAAATAPALAPPILLPLCLPTGAGSSARPRRAARAAVRCELAAAAAASASSTAPAAAPGSVDAPRWAQRTVVIPPQRRGCHIITHKIMHAIRSDLSEFKCGLAHLFLHHTSASLTLNENYDPDVQTDTETFLSRIVPEGPSAPWRHTIEGSDDMPAHIKSSMFGCALTIPITDGRLNMGTWQIMQNRKNMKWKRSMAVALVLRSSELWADASALRFMVHHHVARDGEHHLRP